MRRRGEDLPFGAPERREAGRPAAEVDERLLEVSDAGGAMEILEEAGHEAPRVMEKRLVALASRTNEVPRHPERLVFLLLHRALAEALGVPERVRAPNELAPRLVRISEGRLFLYFRGAKRRSRRGRVLVGAAELLDRARPDRGEGEERCDQDRDEVARRGARDRTLRRPGFRR